MRPTRGVFEDLGIPVRKPQYNGYVITLDRDGNEVIYFCFSQWGASLFLIQVNPKTGEMRQIDVKDACPEHGCSFAKSLILGPDGKIYIGTAIGGFLLCFDPNMLEDGIRVLGRPSNTETYIFSLTVGVDGKIYGGTYGNAKLISYDPATGKMEDLGRMDEDQMYSSTVVAGSDGLIYVGIGTARANIVAYDPKSRRHWSIIPESLKLEGKSGIVMKGGDGKVYGAVGDNYFLIENAQIKPISQKDYPITPPPTLRDGGKIFFDRRSYSYIISGPSGEVKNKFEYNCAGAMVFVVGVGPEDKIYGSSALPLELFVYDPEDGRLEDLGNPTSVDGEIYSMVSLHGKLYVCAYPGAWLSVYDPKKPWNYGTSKNSNPRGIGYVGDGHLRPRAMIVGPEDKIFIGSMPPYGELGGAMAVYDPYKDAVVENYRNLIPNQSIVSLAYEPKSGLIFGGSSIFGGGGTRPVERDAHLFAWDPDKKRKVLDIVPVPRDPAIVSMTVADGKVFAASSGSNSLIVYDSEQWNIVHIERIPFGRPLDISLSTHTDGFIYGIAGRTIFRVDIENYKIEKVAEYNGEISCGFALTDTGVYFGSGVHLIRYKLL